MKLAAIYTLFNGTELLDRSVDQIKDQVDLIILGTQEISNAGNEMSLNDAQNIHSVEGSLLESGHEVILQTYKPDLVYKDRKENERRKLQRLLETARTLGATHWILLAADHFYDPKEFAIAKGKIETDLHSFDVTYTEMITYYKKPTWRLTKKEDYFFPFICKLTAQTHVIRGNHYPVRMDPSVRVSPAETFVHLEEKMIILHHFTMIRKDILNKFNNAAAAQNWGKGKVENYFREFQDYDIKDNPGVSYFGGITVEETVDNFGLESLDLRGY